MAFDPLQMQRIRSEVEAFVERKRPPPQVRDQVDLGCLISGQSILVFEVRPAWNGAPGETTEQGVAKATFVKTTEVWKIYWLRSDLKWHPYPPAPQVGSVGKFLSLVEQDSHGCFFG
jgi:hypothetical protein